MQIEIFENTVCNGLNVKVGDIIETDKDQAKILINRGFAVAVEIEKPQDEPKKAKSKSKSKEVENDA